MVNTNAFLGVMASQGYSQRSLAEAAGMNKNTLNLKINNKADFKTGEIEVLCDVLGITKPSDKANIFLAKVSQI